MTYEETREVLKVIRASYPLSFSKMTVEDMNGFLAVWSDMFEEDNQMLVLTAVKSYIRSNPNQFAPSVGQVVEIMRKLTSAPTMTEQEAWGNVYRALSNSIYNSEKEFEKLPEEVKSTVGNAKQLKEWAQMNNSELNTVVASNFMRSYKARSAENKEFAKLPTQAKAMIQGLTDAKRLNNDISDDE